MKQRLNGWQRIFVVISCLWLLLVAVDTCMAWPESQKVMNKWYRKADRESPTIQAWKRQQGDKIPVPGECAPAVPGLTRPEDGPWCDYQVHQPSPLSGPEAEQYRATIARGEAERGFALLKQDGLFLLSRVLLWIGPLLILYFGTWGMFCTGRWIVRGFRAER
jgi:hypothetical protein